MAPRYGPLLSGVVPESPGAVLITPPGCDTARLRVHLDRNLPLPPLPRPNSPLRSRHGRRYVADLLLRHPSQGNLTEPPRAAVQTILPGPVPVHHLGLYREPSTLEPVEYYNNLPNHISADGSNPDVSSLAIILDPVIATGGTCAAAIQTLREWGVQRIIVMSVIGAAEGVKRAAGEWADATEIWIAGVDEELTPNGMLKPGVGDVGDRLFLTIGK